MAQDVLQQVVAVRQPKPKHSILLAIAERFSPRWFSEDQLKEEDLQTIFEAARWTPSGHNYQPWYFYWTRRGEKTFETILSTLPQFNLWAKTASVLIACCYLDRSEAGKNRFAKHDLGAAVYALVVQAQTLGYYSRQMGVFDKKKLSETLKISQEHTPFVIVAMGKLGDYTKIDPQLLVRELNPKPRKPTISKHL